MSYVVIILNYNLYTDTIKSVNTLINIGVKKIIIVDNCSTDNSYQILKNKYHNYDNISVIRSNKNLGYSGGNNFGIKYAKIKYKDIKYIAIMNPDTVISDIAVFDNLLNKLEKNKKIGVISALQIYNGDLNLRKSAWKEKKFIHILLQYLLMKNLDINGYKELRVDIYKKISYVDTIPGCFFIVRKDLLDEIGYFDENTFLYYEEDIICYKIRKKGYKVALCLESYYEHNHAKKQKINLKNKYNHYKYSLESANYYLTLHEKNIYLKKLLLNFFALIMLPIKMILYLLLSNIKINNI